MGSGTGLRWNFGEVGALDPCRVEHSAVFHHLVLGFILSVREEPAAGSFALCLHDHDLGAGLHHPGHRVLCPAAGSQRPGSLAQRDLGGHRLLQPGLRTPGGFPDPGLHSQFCGQFDHCVCSPLPALTQTKAHQKQRAGHPLYPGGPGAHQRRPAGCPPWNWAFCTWWRPASSWPST